MLTLYVREGCGFCASVLRKVKELGLTVEEKNVADEAIAKELVARGGKMQEPYLVDSDRNIEMYESRDINKYLDEHYGNGVSTTEEDNNQPQVCTLEF